VLTLEDIQKLSGPPQKLAVLSQTRDAFEKGAQNDRVRTRTLDGAIHPDEHIYGRKHKVIPRVPFTN